MTLLQEGRPSAGAASNAPRWNVPLKVSVLLQLFPLLEATSVVLLSMVSGMIFDLVSSGHLGEYGRNFGLGVVVAALFSTTAYARDLYPSSELRRPASQFKEVVLIWTAVFLCLSVVALALKVGDIFSREAVILFFVTGLGGIIFARLGASRLFASLTRSNVLAKLQVVIVAQSDVRSLSSVVQAIKASGCDVCQTITLPPASSEGALLECMDKLVEHVRRRSVDEILLAANWADISLIEKIAGHLSMVPVPVRLLPDDIVSSLLQRPFVNVGGTRAIELQRAPLTAPQLLRKRLFDLVLTSAALPFLLPLLAIVAALVALESRGPVLFCQRRVGFNGRPFKIYKFRTMTILEDGPVVAQACRGDPRVTRVGSILRRTSLDEIPQLWNVLKGEMSLIGPRPHALAHDSEYSQIISFYTARHKVKPGITGWAQINGWRGATPQVDMMIKRVEHDMWYVNNWSAWLDIKILLLTIPRVWTGRNAF
ncbi:Undecaprenyl-phosphate glucose phosphotransferase [Sinorhizobium fredii]|uniref:Putative colanic biosynthesis UDP-glucose lipid carrier transferase WcaJ n=1 Tax=Sinorhizobium fredii (strain USDA 257) TaxID=1185652 RepID=I3X1D3_SINF2|nr:undecaprenyl-phosphate glucose phosphotransferase [Sinorhizobium fredii]AFL49689.1 putative colanic biosynthesis UDP-glucose lipid carrier transferase WcaJ [Sinorhizobium fredii USDA 257]